MLLFIAIDIYYLPVICLQDSAVRQECEAIIAEMKSELVRYAENANQQALDYVQQAVAQCKENSAAKYKKYYQRY